MITAEFYKKQGTFLGFQIKGHADYSDEGNDIVCASVSSAVQLVANTITECFKINANVKVLENRIQLILPQTDNLADKLLQGLFLHMTVLAEDFEGTIKIITSEV